MYQRELEVEVKRDFFNLTIVHRVLGSEDYYTNQKRRTMG